MSFLFASIHGLDIENQRVIPGKKINDYELVVNELLAKIDLEKNTKSYGVSEEGSTVCDKIIYICEQQANLSLTEEEFNKISTEIAERLLEKELIADERMKKTFGNRIQRGSLIQAVKLNSATGGLDYYIAKIEHSEFFTTNDFIKNIGLQPGVNKVFKSCKMHIAKVDSLVLQNIDVYLNNKASYWTTEFLEICEVSSDEKNTVIVFNFINKVLNNKLSQDKSDYLILKNALITYMKQEGRSIDYLDMVDDLVGNYVPVSASSETLSEIKEQLKSDKNRALFDYQFISIPSKIPAKKKTTLSINNGIELVLNAQEPIFDMENTIFSMEREGRRYVVIETNNSDAFNHFKRRGM